MFANIYSLIISKSINSTLSETLISYLRYKFSECLLTTLLAAFFSCLLYFTNERWVSQTLSLHVCMINFYMPNQLQLLIECLSDILAVSGHVLISWATWNKVYIYIYIYIYIYKNLIKKKTFFSCHKRHTRF